MKISKIQKKKRIHLRVRKKVSGTAERPRLSVYRSNKQIYCQLIDDIKEVTLACASSKDAAITASGNKVDTSFAVGKLLAEKAWPLRLRMLFLIEVDIYIMVESKP